MINISQTLGSKVIFIRFNPDSYKVNNKRKNISNKKRHKHLLKCLNHMMNKKYNKLEYLSVVYLYYDNFDKDNIKLKPILKMYTHC